MKQIVIETLDTTDAKKKIEVFIRYELGGMNPFTGEVVPRGYFLSATPFEKDNEFRLISAFSGTKILLEPAKRFSQTRLRQLADLVTEHKEVPTSEIAEKYNSLIDRVLKRNRLDLAPKG